MILAIVFSPVLHSRRAQTNSSTEQKQCGESLPLPTFISPFGINTIQGIIKLIYQNLNVQTITIFTLDVEYIFSFVLFQKFIKKTTEDFSVGSRHTGHSSF